VVLALCIVGVAAATFLLIALVDRPKDRPEYLGRIADEAPDSPDAPAIAPAHPESYDDARVRGAVDLNTGHTVFEITGSPTPEQNEAIAAIVDTARSAQHTNQQPQSPVQTHGTVSPAP
jgi:hypothetical protein